MGDGKLSIENASGASLLQLQYAAEHYHEQGQYLRTTYLVACSEYAGPGGLKRRGMA